MKIIIKALTIAVTILLAPVTGWAEESAAVRAIQEGERAVLFPTRDMIEHGKAVAESACAGCHGMDGISDASGKPHLAGQRTVYTYRVLQAYQAGLRSDESDQHKQYLSDDALLSAAVYYASLMPVRIPEVSVDIEPSDAAASVEAVTLEEDPFEGIRDAMQKCIKCHDESGNSPRKGMPGLTAQSPEYFVTSMRSYIDGGRSHKLMKKLVSKLDEATIQEMGVYYAVQEPLKTETQGLGDANVGRRLAEDCETCHGDDGNTTKSKMPTLAGQDAKYFVKMMKRYKDGKRLHEKMAEAVEELSEQDVIDLATYYAAQEPVKRNVRMPLKSTEWIVRCERCHGIDGNSSDPRFPMLAGQDETYLNQALQAYASGGRDNTTMHAMADPLSPGDIERIASHFATQQPKAVVYMQLPCGDDQSE